MMLEQERLSDWLIYAAMFFTLAVASGCNSGAGRKEAKQKAAAEQKSASAQDAVDPRIDLNCIFDHIQNPTEAFHYSYKHDGPNFVEEEADVTPQTIDGSFKNNAISRPVHGARSDANSWQSGWTALTGISGMSSTVALVNNSSAMVREGAEKMNGYDAIRYSIDTARASGAEIGLYRSTLGAGGFEKGTVWVTSQGCPVKLDLNVEMHQRDGSVDKTHYEQAMIRK